MRLWNISPVMMTLVVLVMLVTSPSTDGQELSCYKCVDAETTDLGLASNTCPQHQQPLTRNNTDTCGGKLCLIIWSDYVDHGYVSNLTCLTNELGNSLPQGIPYKVQNCLLLNQIQRNFRFYKFDGMCCFSVEKVLNESGVSVPYNVTSCGCDTDYCNANFVKYHTSKKAVAGTTAKATETYDHSTTVASAAFIWTSSRFNALVAASTMALFSWAFETLSSD